ncbi:MAG: hypothetical protein AAGF74_09435 [Pseudomonadota bacterium]
MRRFLALLAIAAPAVAYAQPQLLGADEFHALTEGRTLTFADRSGWTGYEQYLPNNRVIWLPEGGDCKHGIWYPEGERICFLYEDSDIPACWAVFQNDEGVTVISSDLGAVQDVVNSTEEPLQCPAPGVGV